MFIPFSIEEDNLESAQGAFLWYLFIRQFIEFEDAGLSIVAVAV